MSVAAQRLAGRVALVTGAGSGIGRESARRLAAEGASVVVTDVDLARATETAEPLGASALALRLDVTDADDVAAAVARAVQEFGALHVLHANAAIPQPVRPIEELEPEEWRRVLEVNLTGPFLCIRGAVAELRRTKGAVVVTSSVSSMRIRDGISAYTASKAGVNGLVQALAYELAPAGVRVNAVVPGPVETPFLRGMKFAATPEETVAAAEAGIPLGRLVEPASVAAAVAYLASDDARDVTGVLLRIDGGRGL
ncbi:MAG: glucose 1-dehydrogenase [Solirubrobacterales bacterium]|nr:glucose 1-dehydrogenase [Solirubrobacterales bacterium]